MSGHYGPEVRREVRRSYVSDRQNLKACSSLHDVPYDTVRRWKREDAAKGNNWDQQRRAVQMSEGGIGDLTKIVLESFIPFFESTIKALKEGQFDDPIKQAEAISRLADAFQKTVKAAGAVDPELARLAISMDVIKELAAFVREKFPQHQAAVLEMLEPFGEHISQLYG